MNWVRRRTILSVVAVVIFLSILGYGIYFSYTLYSFSKAISIPTPKIATAEGEGMQQTSQADVNKEDIPREPKEKSVGKNLNILVVGVDNGKMGVEGEEYFRDGVGRTDTIMVFSINQTTRQISLLSVPRDTYVNIPGRGMDKVNHAHAFGGMQLSIATLSKFLGISIDHYVKFNYEGFVKAVDAIDGVNVDVQEDVKSFMDGKVKIPKGEYHMDGRQAFDFVHFREWDIPRIKRQQQFVKALATQHLGLASITKIPKILGKVSSDIETDLAPKDMMTLAMELPYMNTDNIQSKTVPGKAQTIKGISYWVPDIQGTQQTVIELMH